MELENVLSQNHMRNYLKEICVDCTRHYQINLQTSDKYKKGWKIFSIINGVSDVANAYFVGDALFSEYIPKEFAIGYTIFNGLVTQAPRLFRFEEGAEKFSIKTDEYFELLTDIKKELVNQTIQKNNYDNIVNTYKKIKKVSSQDV